MVVAATVPQIAVDFEHGRLREAGQMKKDDEGIPFHTYLPRGRIVVIEFCGGRCGGCSVHLFWASIYGGSAPAVCRRHCRLDRGAQGAGQGRRHPVARQQEYAARAGTAASCGARARAGPACCSCEARSMALGRRKEGAAARCRRGGARWLRLFCRWHAGLERLALRAEGRVAVGENTSRGDADWGYARIYRVRRSRRRGEN
jgi:hypothetical protein